MQRRLALLLAFVIGVPLSPASAQRIPTIAAASDLQFAMGEIAERFRRDSGTEVKLIFGSSGNFFQQLRQGAPFDIYMSADEDYVLKLAEAGIAADKGALYAVGRIAIIAPHGSTLAIDGRLEGLRAALAQGRITRFAIANPEHAPYGRRAEEVLKHVRLWDDLKPRLVFGENVSQAAQYATSGSAEGGIIAYSLALAPSIARLGTSALIPEEWHQPLRQRMALMKNAVRGSSRFYDYVQQPEARRIFKRYGFILPGEEG